jgi:hypothetical protein
MGMFPLFPLCPFCPPGFRPVFSLPFGMFFVVFPNPSHDEGLLEKERLLLTYLNQNYSDAASVLPVLGCKHPFRAHVFISGSEGDFDPRSVLEAT